MKATSVSPERRSPEVLFNRKIQDLTKKYGGHNLSGAKLLIKLNSAAIQIQYHMRRHLSSKQFYQTDAER